MRRLNRSQYKPRTQGPIMSLLVEISCNKTAGKQQGSKKHANEAVSKLDDKLGDGKPDKGVSKMKKTLNVSAALKSSDRTTN
mmetsp:Transcript_37483/g.57402  ORF Transcript_37483/g.57402 Transcript_37483/m.57402 type:complete len:82 (+) Transcript_37483:1601-1846(+)